MTLDVNGNSDSFASEFLAKRTLAIINSNLSPNIRFQNVSCPHPLGEENDDLSKLLKEYPQCGGFTMRVRYGTYSEYNDEELGFDSAIRDRLVKHVVQNLATYFRNKNKLYNMCFGLNLRLFYDEYRASQAFIDALQDLVRANRYHRNQYPDLLMWLAYFSYWWMHHQPLTFDIFKIQPSKLQSILKDSKLDQLNEYYAKIIGVNADWLVSYIESELFAPEMFDSDLTTRWNDYLFYYFSYRVETPKSIEAILSALFVNPGDAYRHNHSDD